MFKKVYLPIFFLFFTAFHSFSQVTLLEEDLRGGSLPAGWTETSVTFSTSSGGYANFTSTSSILTSPVIDLSGHTSVALTFDVAKFGSGTDGPLTVQVSTDGGSTWTAQEFNSPTPSGSSYLTSGPTTITSTSANTRIRWIRINSPSQKRLRDILLTGVVASTDTRIQFGSATSTLAEGDGVFIDIPVSISNPSGSVATTVEVNLSGGTATNGTDYDDGAGTPMAITFPQTLTFPAGSSADQNFTIYISNDDTEVEGNETVILSLQNPNGGTIAALGSQTSHTLTITDNDLPNLVINEIMYNSTGTDDEWIEIYNAGVSVVDLENYILEYDGSTFTFPTGAPISAGGYVTIAVGSNGDGTFNNDNSFVPNFSAIGPSPANTNNTNNLVNSSALISLKAPDNTTIDMVTYDDGAPWPTAADGNGPSLELSNPSSENSLGTNWFAGSNGGSPGNMNILPVELVSFNVNKDHKTVVLTWKTITEIENSHFIIQKSTNGNDFSNISEIKGAGTSLLPIDYSFIDKQVTIGKNYYRLKQVDFDGSYTYSKIISVNFGDAGQTKLYPTATADFITLEFNANSNNVQEKILTIYDLNGKIVWQNVLENVEAEQQRINVAELHPGHYFLRIISGNEIEALPFIKK